jgi:membrane protein DedA with SNARE-associated domain
LKLYAIAFAPGACYVPPDVDVRLGFECVDTRIKHRLDRVRVDFSASGVPGPGEPAGDHSVLALAVAASALAISQWAEASPSTAKQIILLAFDPAWNVEHRFSIFAAIMLLLLLAGVGLPLPEDVPLTLAGFTVSQQTHGQFAPGHFLVAFALVVVPIIAGDLVAYGLGRRFGLGLSQRIVLFRRILTPPRLARVQDWFTRYGSFAVFLGRQVAGVRFVTFFTAGAMRMPVPKFVAFDLLGCTVSVPIWFTLGALASRYGERWLHHAMHTASHTVLLAVLGLAALLALVVRLKRRARNAAKVPDLP